MTIGVIQATSQKDKNALLYSITKEVAEAKGHNVVNFGMFADESENYSYVETAVCASMLLLTKAVDFIVTGCSSGQGMMLALNALPAVMCGYCPTAQDAFLFGRINAGNAVSLPLGLNFGWCGEINLRHTIEALFEGDFGTGYPAQDAERKKKDTALVKSLYAAKSPDYSFLPPGLLAKARHRLFCNKLKPILEKTENEQSDE